MNLTRHNSKLKLIIVSEEFEGGSQLKILLKSVVRYGPPFSSDTRQGRYAVSNLDSKLDFCLLPGAKPHNYPKGRDWWGWEASNYRTPCFYLARLPRINMCLWCCLDTPVWSCENYCFSNIGQYYVKHFICLCQCLRFIFTTIILKLK